MSEHELDDRTRRAMEAAGTARAPEAPEEEVTGEARRREVVERAKAAGAEASRLDPFPPLPPRASDGDEEDAREAEAYVKAQAGRSETGTPAGMRDDPETASAPLGQRWVFDETVVAAFEDMLERSIPNYPHMRRIVTDVVCWHADATGQERPLVVDLGASRGAGVQPIIDRIGGRANYVLVEESEPMLAALRERFEDWGDTVAVMQHDLREGLPPLPSASAIMSVLTLQFVPIERRQRLLREVHRGLHPRGAFILVEKVLGATAELDALEVDLYWSLKRENGYTQEAIQRKALSLEGALVPLTARMNEDLLRDAGFTAVDCVWAWSNFRAWVAVKR